MAKFQAQGRKENPVESAVGSPAPDLGTGGDSVNSGGIRTGESYLFRSETILIRQALLHCLSSSVLDLLPYSHNHLIHLPISTNLHSLLRPRDMTLI
jgi:hypothetical protein